MISIKPTSGLLGARSARGAVAILAATNLMMVAVMAIAPVPVADQVHGHDLGLVGIVVGLHVAGIFVPSPISVRAAERVGPTVIAGGGFLLIVASGVTGLLFDAGSALWTTVVLGVGWNLGVVHGWLAKD